MARRYYEWFEEIFGIQEPEYAEVKNKFSCVGTGAETKLIAPNGVEFRVGDFSTPSVEELHVECGKEVVERKEDDVGLRFKNILDDVSSLHMKEENHGAVFQVASQFNGLEMVGPGVTPEMGISRYFDDRTQGPACALSCPAATLYRNYFYNGGQTQQVQLDLLSDVGKLLDNSTKNYWKMRNGYALLSSKESLCELKELLLSDPELQDKVKRNLRVGIHWNTQVLKSKLEVAQVFCSGLPVSYSEIDAKNSDWVPFANLILQGAFEATIAAGAILAKQRKTRVKVFLTALGNGAFGNLTIWVKEALQNALNRFSNEPVDVYLVHYFRGAIQSEFVNLAKEVNSASSR